MTDKTLLVPVQYVLHSSTEAFVRPYELSSGLLSTTKLWLEVSPLPQDNHWKLVLEAEAIGRTADNTVGLVTRCGIEAIVFIDGLTDDEVQPTLRLVAAPSVLGSVRALLASLSQGTGLGTVLLPPMSAEQVNALPSKPPL